VIVLATTSDHKAHELGRLLGREVHALPGYVAPVEDGPTFAANAEIKARAGRVVAPPDAWVLADDSGLCVAALDGAPGILSARFGGEGLDDAGRTAHLLTLLDGQRDRRAAFVCALVAIAPDGSLTTAEGRVDGEIATAPRGANGFGYDPVFVPVGATRTTAELSATEKDAISHRGSAARRLRGALGW
jgi:XTP/dITP diphosphohydrolase